MARLRLTLHGISCFDNESLVAKTSDLSISTEKETATTTFQVGNSKYQYTLNLVDFSFKKKMYQPTEVTADIQFTMAIKEFKTIDKPTLVSLFSGKKVSLVEMYSLKSDQPDNVLYTIGTDYYVHDVQPRYKQDALYVTLKINSLDKKMTLQHACHSFVAKKLVKDILAPQINSFITPWDATTTEKSYVDKMKHLYFTIGSTNYEHTFPYLVQYNESFYDFMARTANRWGEFLYYEDGKLRIGYDETKTAGIGNYNTITYVDLADTPLIDDKAKYDCIAADEKGLLDSTLRKSPAKVKGTLFSPGDDGDKVAMKKISGFFKNDKNLPTFIVGQLIDDTFDFARRKIAVDHSNDEFDSKYFPDTKDYPERFGEHNFGDDKDPDNDDGHNLFSELDSKYGESKYREILTKEILAAKDALHIYYDTTNPQLKLGNIITYNSVKYIVVEISSRTVSQALEFEVIATPANSDKKFYPTVIPAGHVRYADPQLATVEDADDPDGGGRVRVKFNWNEKDEEATPWIKYTANAGGQKGFMGKHYKDDKVLIGYIDGNVERPYVLGAVSKGTDADIHCVTPGGRVFKMEDDSGGIQRFLTSMFLPMWGTLGGFVPKIDECNPYSESENNLAMAGGFEISDKYGIYKISGSTDSREVNISSPWGDVNINAFTGISISAPNGDISIKGKNVTIEAGNNLELISGKNVNYKLWKEKTTGKGELAQILLDIPAIVAKKLAEMALNIVDLSIVRSVVDIVMRPVEGSLTVKSNRFLKLEAGKNSCDIPADGYTNFKTRYEGFKNKMSTKYSAGSLIPHLDMGSSMKEIFEKIGPMVNTLDQKYKTIYNNCVKLRGDLKTHLEELDKWVQDDGAKSYDAADFDALYNKLKSDLWKEGKYEAFKEDKLIKDDQVPVKDGSGALMSIQCWQRNQQEFRLHSSFEDKEKLVVKKRKELRKAALKDLNNLRKEICKLLSLEFDPHDIGKQLAWFVCSPAPEDFKKKMNSAFSRKSCVESKYYKFENDDVRKALTDEITANLGLTNNDLTFMKRVVAMNLLDQFGFTDDFRKAVGGSVPHKPVADPDATKDDSIMKADVWKNYVASLSGIPNLGRDITGIAAAIEGAAKDAYDKIAVWDNFIERFSWGDGKKGQILFGADGETYALKNQSFDPVKPLDPKNNCLRDDDATLGDKEKTLVVAFVQKIRDAIKDY